MVVPFQLGKIPVRVHGSFFLTGVLLGATGGANLATIVIWLAVVFVSVLLHELGHALIGKAFGLTPEIDLHGMGGTTSWPRGKKLSTVRKVLVSLAGPFFGIGAGLAIVVFRAWRETDAHGIGELAHASTELLRDWSHGGARGGSLMEIAYGNLLWVNLGWGALNLVPMLPLDGGNVMAAIFQGLLGARGMKLARIVSVLVAALAIVASLVWLGLFAAILAGLFGFQSIQALRSEAKLPPTPPMSGS